MEHGQDLYRTKSYPLRCNRFAAIAAGRALSIAPRSVILRLYINPGQVLL